MSQRVGRRQRAMKSFLHAVVCVLGLAVCFAQIGHTAKFEEVIQVVERRRLEISTHKFFEFLKDESLPVARRMTFAPYWTFFAMSAADILDNWIRIPNPTNKLEMLVNVFAEEDDFHYNFFLYDLEKVLGYTIDRYGSYEAVVRHLWSDESKAVRQLMYSWISMAKKYDDPMVVLATIEATEAGLKDIFEAAFEYLYMNGREGGIKELEYFGLTHVELEVNHTMTSWFAAGDKPFRPLADYDISEETKDHAIEVVEEMMEGYKAMYDALYNLLAAEDTIRPEKYEVEGWPPITAFPKDHPNRPVPRAGKDEL